MISMPIKSFFSDISLDKNSGFPVFPHSNYSRVGNQNGDCSGQAILKNGR